MLGTTFWSQNSVWCNTCTHSVDHLHVSVFTLAGGKLNKVDVGDVQPLCGEQVAQAEQQEGHVGQQPVV